MCTVLLPPGDNPIDVNKYIISYHFREDSDKHHDKPQQGKSVLESQFEYGNSGYEPEG